MIIFSSRKLESALAEKRLTSWQKAKYIIVPAVFFILIGGPLYVLRPIYGTRQPLFLTICWCISSILSALLTYRGIKMCFHANEAGDGKDFLARLAILTLPVAAKYTVLFIPFTLCLLIILRMMSKIYPWVKEQPVLVFYGVIPLAVYVYYVLIRRSFNRFAALLERKDTDS